MAQGPVGPPKLHLVANVQFGDLRQVRTCQTEAFFSKLLCLARMLRNVTKSDQHGSGSRRSPKTALGCTISILAIPNRSGPVKQRPFFQTALPSPNNGTPATMCVHTCTPTTMFVQTCTPLPGVSIHVPPLPCLCPYREPHFDVCP